MSNTWIEQLSTMVNGLMLTADVCTYRKDNNVAGEVTFRVRVSTSDTKDSIVVPSIASQEDWSTLKELSYDAEKPLSMNILNESMRLITVHLGSCEGGLPPYEKCEDELMIEKSMTVDEVLDVVWKPYMVIWDYLHWFSEYKVEKPTSVKIARKGKF